MKRPRSDLGCSSGVARKASRRRFLQQAGVLAAASVSTGLGLGGVRQTLAKSNGGQTLKIGVFGPSHCAAPFVYALVNDYYKKQKLNVELINYAEMLDAARDLAHGKLDLTQLMVPLSFALHTGSGPFAEFKTPVVLTQMTGVNGSALMVRKGAGIRSPKDFRKRIIASHARYSTHYLYVRLFLEKHGIDYQKDTQFKIIPLEKTIPAMAKGEVDSLFLMEPRNAIIENKGIGTPYMLSKYIWPNHPCCGLVARRDTFEKNRDMVAAVTQEVTRAALAANVATSRKKTIDILRKAPNHKFDTLPKEVLEKAFTPGRSDFAPFPYESSALVVIELMKKYELLPANVVDKELAKEVFQADFTRSILKSLGSSAPATNLRPEKIMGETKVYA